MIVIREAPLCPTSLAIAAGSCPEGPRIVRWAHGPASGGDLKPPLSRCIPLPGANVKRTRKRLLSMSRIPGLAAGAGLAAALLLSAVGLPQAALTEGRAAPASGGRPLLLAQAPAAPAPNVEAFIADMHQRLAITPAQEPQFDAFANVLRQNAQIRPSPPSTN